MAMMLPAVLDVGEESVSDDAVQILKYFQNFRRQLFSLGARIFKIYFNSPPVHILLTYDFPNENPSSSSRTGEIFGINLINSLHSDPGLLQEDDEEEEEQILTFKEAIIWLAIDTVLVSGFSEVLVGSIEGSAESWKVPKVMRDKFTVAGP